MAGDYGEPWHVSGNFVLDREGAVVVTMSEAFFEKDKLERIATCVNRCRGIEEIDILMAVHRIGRKGGE